MWAWHLFLEGQISVVFFKIGIFLLTFLRLSALHVHINKVVQGGGVEISVDLSLLVLLHNTNFVNNLN